MKMRPIPLPQIIPEAPSTGPSYRSDRVAAQQLARTQRRKKRKDKAGDESDVDGSAGNTSDAADSGSNQSQSPITNQTSPMPRPIHGPGSRIDTKA
jgi:hypothetical protein